MIQTSVQIRFTVGPEGYSDAIYVPVDRWASMTQTEIDAAIQDRYTAWKTAVEEARKSVPEDPPAEVAVECEDGATVEV